MPRARASTSRCAAAALPPPDFGFQITTGCFGGTAVGNCTWIRNAARAAIVASTRTTARITTSARIPPTATATNELARRSTASTASTVRPVPRRRIDSHPATNASSSSTEAINPRGKLRTALRTTTTATTNSASAAMAATRRDFIDRYVRSEFSQAAFSLGAANHRTDEDASRPSRHELIRRLVIGLDVDRASA